jgi:hypothetical protein
MPAPHPQAQTKEVEANAALMQLKDKYDKITTRPLCKIALDIYTAQKADNFQAMESECAKMFSLVNTIKEESKITRFVLVRL